MDEKEFQQNDESDSFDGTVDMDLDASQRQSRLATVDSRGVLTLYTQDLVEEESFNFDMLQ